MNKALVAIKTFIINKKSQRIQTMKDRMLKNNEGMLDVLSTVIQAGKQCPHLAGILCIGKACHFFHSWNVPTGKKDDQGNDTFQEQWRCVVVQNSMLIIETSNLLVHLSKQQDKTNKILMKAFKITQADLE